MSAPDTSDLRALETKLAALVAEAREAGLQMPLRKELLRLARECSAGTDTGAGDIPMQFGMVGDSPAMHEVFKLLERIAPSDVSVLVQGETGTGKELVARALHDFGLRADERLLAENCAAVPANLLESELFGHKKGSFTGAESDRAGHFVTADGGTVFLDEIGDMPLDMQAKLLRVLQDGEVRPVGSNDARKVDVRIVAATNKDLATMCRTKEFREDLYFRLNVITLQLPPLRERVGDVPHLVNYFAGRVAEESGIPRPEVTPAAMALLEAWSWPGNVRELENQVRRALALSAGPIGPDDLSPALAGKV